MTGPTTRLRRSFAETYRLKKSRMRIFRTVLLAIVAAASVSGIAQKAPLPKQPAQPAPVAVSTVKADAPLLPSAFSGWEAAGTPQPLKDPAQADAPSAVALKEYGFTDGLAGDYQRDSQSLKIKALRFDDASGAYGAYSFYRHSGWPRVEVGSGGASDNNRVLFWIGNILIDAQFQRVTVMSASELRELAAALPKPAGNKSLPPPILSYLPQKALEAQTTHYALGPAGYTGANGQAGVLPPWAVGFDHGAEVATASYSLSSNEATLTIINYPTPQLAAAQEQTILAYLKGGNTPQHPFTKALEESNPAAIEVRRSGPLLALVTGDAIQDQAHKLVSLVHYEADTASLPGGGINPVQNFAKLIIGIIVLVVVMFIAALCVALFLGGGRAAFRVLRGKPASSMYDEDFTRLDLRE